MSPVEKVAIDGATRGSGASVAADQRQRSDVRSLPGGEFFVEFFCEIYEIEMWRAVLAVILVVSSTKSTSVEPVKDEAECCSHKSGHHKGKF